MNYRTKSDQHLLELAQGGDRNGFGELARRWESKIYGFIRRNVRNAEDARDLMQETFMKAYLNLQRLEDPQRFGSWLYTIALNECRMNFRKGKSARLTPIEEEHEALHDHGIESRSPERTLVRDEAALRVRRGFAQLPHEQREVILLKEYQGLKFHEIAEILEVPLSTVKSRMYLGLKNLKRVLENER